MSVKDKLELGLKPDAAFRPDNLPDFQKDDPSCQVAGEPGESGRVERAREECTEPVQGRKAAAGKKTTRRRGN